MGSGNRRRRLIVNADDFGRSSSINRAVIEAHQVGILTTASLMVTGEACEEAVELARENPKLGVGLHLTLCCGIPALKPQQVASLITMEGKFSDDPVHAGLRYFFNPNCREELALEIDAQFRRFEATGLTLDHVNGHLHFHLHPVVFGILQRRFARWNVKAIRLTREPWEENFLQENGRWGYRMSHAFIFDMLSRRSRKGIDGAGLKYTERVCGLLQDGMVTEGYLLRLLEGLPPGSSEIYSHPSMDAFRHEYEALISTRVRSLIQQLGIELIRYQDL